VIYENRTFFALQGLLLAFGAYPFFGLAQVALFLRFNSLHNPILDRVCSLMTFLGSGVAYAAFMGVLVLFRQRIRVLLIGMSGFGLVSLVVQVMKHVIYADCLRPLALIPTHIPVHVVEGITQHLRFSFPSGHAATIFTMVCCIQLLMPKKIFWLSIVLLLIATFVSYTRIYLAQHFYSDVYIGAWVGAWVMPCVYWVLMQWQGPRWLDQSIRW